MTRGDKFRNMTDEQLVEFAFENGADDCFRFCKNKEECEYDMDRKELEEKCKQCMLEWIKEEEGIKKYKCIEPFIVDNYDADGFLIENSVKVIEEGEIYTLDESGSTIIGGEVHLEHKNGSWIEITRDRLNEYFEEVE